MSLGGFHQINITSRLVQSHSSGGVAGGSYPAAALLRRISLLRDQRRWGWTWSASDRSSSRRPSTRGSQVPLVAKCHKARSLRHKIAMIENESRTNRSVSRVVYREPPSVRFR